MKICLDARQVRRYPTGLGSYAKHVVQHLAAVDDENEYVVLRHNAQSPIVEQDNFVERSLPYSIFSVHNLVAGAAAIRSIGADVYHSLFHFLPLGSLPRTVVSLHDLIAVEHSKLSLEAPAKRWWKSTCVRPWLRHSLVKASRVLALSESTRSAALAHYPLRPERVITVLPGVNTHLWHETQGSEVPEVARMTAGRRFIFSLGNSHPYKNIPRVVRAFASIAPTFADVDLIVTGRDNSLTTLQRLANQTGVGERVKFTGAASDAQVKGYFQQALFFAFPSLVEGFGLPVLEAMACGCPVLTSDCSALKEAAEGAALLTDPTDTAAIAAAMTKLIQRQELRLDLIQKGRERARGMTWARSVE